MVKVFIYKDYDLLEELYDIYMIDTANGSAKDKALQKMMKIIREAAEIMIKENGKNNL